MKIVAKHKFAPLIALEDGSVIDTDDLEVIGTGTVSGDSWEFNVQDVEPDPRWIEIASADRARLSVNQKRANSGERTFRAPKVVRDELARNGVETPLAAGSGLTLQQLEDLINEDGVEGLVLDWAAHTLNKHQQNPHAEQEDALFAEAEPGLDYAAIDSAMDDEPTDYVGVTAAGETAPPAPAAAPQPAAPTGDAAKISDPPPGQFSKTVYIAIVEDDDTESVQDLIALVQTASGSADAYSYVGGTKGWKEAAKTLSELQSPAPPPVIQLQDWQVNSIIQQIQGATGNPGKDSDSLAPVQASAFEIPEATILWGPDNKQILSIIAMGVPGRGGVDPAQKLRDYWQTGTGGAKIRWDTPGDWKRCYRHLSKYLGPRAAGYCQLMHKRMTGVYTGSRFNVGGNGHHHASLESSEEAEFNVTGRKATGQRTTNSVVPGSRSTGTGSTQVTVPLGQHYAGGPGTSDQRPASPDAPHGGDVKIDQGPQPSATNDVGKTPAQIAAEQRALAAEQAAAAAAQKKAAAAETAKQKAAAAAQKQAAHQQAAQQKAAAAAQKKAAAAQKKAAAPKKSSKATGPHKTHSQAASSQKRVPKGQTGGGRFAPGPARSGTAGTTGHTYAEIASDPHNKQMYSDLVGKGSAQQRSYVKGLSNSDLQNLTGIVYSSRTSNQSVVQARNAVASELAKRGMDRKAYGALG